MGDLSEEINDLNPKYFVGFFRKALLKNNIRFLNPYPSSDECFKRLAFSESELRQTYTKPKVPKNQKLQTKVKACTKKIAPAKENSSDISPEVSSRVPKNQKLQTKVKACTKKIAPAKEEFEDISPEVSSHASNPGTVLGSETESTGQSVSASESASVSASVSASASESNALDSKEVRNNEEIEAYRHLEQKEAHEKKLKEEAEQRAKRVKVRGDKDENEGEDFSSASEEEGDEDEEVSMFSMASQQEDQASNASNASQIASQVSMMASNASNASNASMQGSLAGTEVNTGFDQEDFGDDGRGDFNDLLD